jgi:hypothetical protein
MPSYRRLDHARITQTAEELHARIISRFPEANLARLCEQLLAVSRETAGCVAALEAPIWPLRIGVAIAVLALVTVFAAVAGLTLTAAPRAMSISDLVQTIEAGVNDVVFFGIAVFFLMGIETRVKRRRALRIIHELRSLAHIVDMHQLTKDPERLAMRSAGSTTSGAATWTSGADLGKYLDFCSELLSVISKIAALFPQHFNDGIVLAAVNEIEGLTTALSGKIWQKITILDRGMAPQLSSSE